MQLKSVQVSNIKGCKINDLIFNKLKMELRDKFTLVSLFFLLFLPPLLRLGYKECLMVSTVSPFILVTSETIDLTSNWSFCIVTRSHTVRVYIDYICKMILSVNQKSNRTLQWHLSISECLDSVISAKCVFFRVNKILAELMTFVKNRTEQCYNCKMFLTRGNTSLTGIIKFFKYQAAQYYICKMFLSWKQNSNRNRDTCQI